MQIVIPSQKEAPLAIKYMLSLGDKWLSHAELDQMERELQACRLFNSCWDCEYSDQCKRLFDMRVDRGKWE